MKFCPECYQEALKLVEERVFECKFCNAQIVHEGNGFVVERI